ncbi:rhamnogalacturonan lyase family protein [Flavobacterium flavipallidum]|uniref:T9SS type A sorting domain-containing protein n=1 Tax=Flavobacterium flavipallidum TaxID=3139140 RepID=A0ABU9HLE5_9FLAO
MICFFFICISINAQQWSILGNEEQISAVASSNTSIAVIKNGTTFTPYVVFTESGVPKVKKRLSDGTWIQVGSELNSSASYTKIYTDAIGDLYVTYIDLSSGSKLALKKLDYATETWGTINPDDPNSLYISSGNANGMSSVGQYSSTARCSLAFDSFNTPYIAYLEGSGSTGMAPTVKKYNGTSWVTVGTGAVSTDYAAAPGLAIDATDKLWMVYCKLSAYNSTTGVMALYNFNGNNWTLINNNPVTSGIRHTNIAIKDNNNIAIAYFNTANTNRATVILYDKSTDTWGTAATLASRDSPNISLINDSLGNLYCSFIDYTSSTTVYPTRVRFLAAGSTTWTELKDPNVTRGVDEPTGSPAIAIGNAPYPYVIYTKSNSNSITTPIVRLYVPPPPPAELTTNNPNTITTTSVVSGGNITSDGGVAVTERGVVYSNSNSSPTINDGKVVDANAGLGNYSVTLSGLTPGTFYYARAYAVNGGVASYGNTVRISTLQIPDAVVSTPKQMEYLTRGLVAIQKSSSSVFLSWRFLGDDPSGIAFNVYRNGVKVNGSPITTSTNYTDITSTSNNNYSITTILNGVESEQTIPVNVWALNTFNTSGHHNKLYIPLQIPTGGTLPDGQTYTYTANDASVGDVDGDGTYEIILKWDPTIVNDNAGGYSGKQIFDCYKLDGTRLWRIDLGINVNAGPHYNQFMVYDFDGDGKAEIILKTADGTVDGQGNVIGNASVDYRNTSGWVQSGPEFLTVFNGLTGAAMASTTYQPSRDNVSDWGDSYGNRQDRFVSAVAYLDGARPSLIVARGYYNRLVRAAYNWRNGQLTMLWKFDSKDPNHPEYNSYSGQGNHQMTIGDVDGDGKDEVINGSSAINDDGKPLWTYGLGHGDALHMTDMDLDKPGQEIWINLEAPGSYDGMGLRQYEAKTGRTNWGIATTGDVGRSMAADLDPYFKGYEMWGSSGDGTYDAKGNLISTNRPSYNFGIWWDGDLGRELFDRSYIDKWNPSSKSAGRLYTIYNDYPVSTNNSTKSNPCLQADILGDWREELIMRKSDNTELVIFTTDTPTDYRIPTLMHDPQYRTAIAWQNSAYNQPPYPSYYIGYDMDVNNIPTAKISIAGHSTTGVTSILRKTPSAASTNASSVTYNVTFSANVNGIDSSDFSITATGNATGTIALVTTITSSSYDVTVNNISGNGTLRLDLNTSGTGISDDSSNAIKSGFTSGEIYTIDNTLPTLSTVTITSNNTTSALAKTGNTVTLNFTASEAISAPVVTIAGHNVTATNASGNNYTATYVLTNTDSEGIIPFNIQFSDVVGNAGTAVSTTTDAKTVTFDRTAPTLSAVTFTSNNANNAVAKTGSIVTINFTASEAISSPTVTIAGHSVTTSNTSGNNYSAAYTMTTSDTEGTIPFTIDVADLAGNTAAQVTTAASTINFTKNITSLTTVTIASNNTTPTVAKTGDIVTLNFTASTTISNVIVSIAGHSVTATNVSGNSYIATFTMTSTDSEGVIPFSITFKDAAGDAMPTVSASTDGKTVIFDKTNPTLSTVTIVSNNATTTLAKTANVVTLNFTASESISVTSVSTAGHTITASNTSGNNYSTSYTMTSSDSEGIVPFAIQFKDLAGNIGTTVSTTTDTKTVTFDRTLPTLSMVTFVSNNTNTKIAKEGDVVTLNFTASEAISLPTITIAGHAVSATNISGNNYKATYTMVAADAEGVIPFTINFADLAGNAGTQVSTASSTVTFKHTTPKMKVYVETPTCPGKANGKIIIGSDLNNYTYNLTITGNGINIALTNQTITSTINWERSDFAAGTYLVTIAIPSISFQESYNVVVKELSTISAKRDTTDKTVSYTVSGSNEYTVTVNGVSNTYITGTTDSASIQIDGSLLQANNTVVIATDSECQGAVQDIFAMSPSITIQPNPTSDIVYIQGVSKGLIQVYSNNGALLQEANAEKTNSINLRGYATGLYLIKITQGTTVETFKVILK